MIAPLIVIIDSDPTAASRVARELEFFDEANVCVAAPGDWREYCERQPVFALFVGPGIGAPELPALFDAVEAWNPNVPLVLLERPQEAA